MAAGFSSAWTSDAVTECGRCGDCCEKIDYQADWNYLRQWVEWWENQCEWAMLNLLDGEDGNAFELTEEQQRILANVRFIWTHWTPHPDDAGLAMPGFQCSAFDRETRLCTAHEHRPPICRDFPWYEQSDRTPRFSPRCTFWADVPLEERPGGKLRALPVLAGRN